MSYLPRSIAITGSGIIAVEYAKIFRKLGSKVTLIFRDSSPKKALEKIGIDKDITAALVSDLRRSGVSFEKASVCESFVVPSATGLKKQKKRLPLEITLKSSSSSESLEKKILKVDAYVAAVGRRPRTGDLNLEKIAVNLDEFGNVLVDANLRSSNPRVFAAGDVLGRPFLASTGVAQGLKAVVGAVNLLKDNLSDAKETNAPSIVGASFDPVSMAADPFAFPVGIWTSPEVAWFGLSLAQCAQRNIKAVEGIGLYREILRGVVFSPDGLLK